MTEVEQRVERILRETLSIEVPSPTSDIVETGLLDSLGLVTLLFELEQQFAITIPLGDLDIESLRTVERVAALVKSISSQPETPPAVDGGVSP